MNFKEEQKAETALAEEIIHRYLPAEEGFQRTLLEAMNYSMTAGGKRLRPILMRQAYRMFGGTGNVIEPFMAAMEMIHTHSLIHDDLPAIDNDEYRRGRKTTHIVYGEAMAILAGDALLNYAYETACQAFQFEPENPGIGRALTILTRKTGVYGMLGGQSVDVQYEGYAPDRDRIDFIYRLKTSALIEASLMVGAALAGASGEEIDAMEEIGRDVGLAFQIRDDILDVTSTTEVLGKPVNSDEKNHKATYVTLEGIEKAKEDVETISKRAVARLDGLKASNPFLRSLILDLVSREK
ncbi:MAG: polyprenyl synthetase family protein [Eubacteriales bacterium]|nr:polyprenyl synthetase family protein [Eubacteriales bacterium]